MSDICKKHNVPLSFGPCDRCDGQGYTQWDLDEKNDPLSFHDGKCFECRGSGTALYKTCEICEMDAYYEENYDEGYLWSKRGIGE